jgi:hypothetical protein
MGAPARLKFALFSKHEYLNAGDPFFLATIFR